MAAIEVRDPYTRGHSERVTACGIALADSLGLPERDREVVALAGLLHDVGKIGVPEAVLNKPGSLADDERLVVQRHPTQGESIVRHVRHPRTAEVAEAVRHHHERWDGHGYPDGLAERQNSLPGRILSLADAWDAMTSDRPYRRGFPEAVAAGLLREGAGTQWDPELAAAFLDMREKGALAAALAPGGMVSRTRFLACPVDGEARSILDAVTIPPPARS